MKELILSICSILAGIAVLIIRFKSPIAWGYKGVNAVGNIWLIIAGIGFIIIGILYFKDFIC